MAAPRLTFLYPFLFAPARTSIVLHASRTARRGVKGTARRTQESVSQRYGTANEPPPHLVAGKSAESKETKETTVKEAKEKPKTNGRAKKAKAAVEDKTKPEAPPRAEAQDKKDITIEEPFNAKSEELPETQKDASPTEQGQGPSSQAEVDAAKPSITMPEPLQSLKALAPSLDLTSPDSPPAYPPPPSPKLPSSNPLETVLNMPSSDDLGTAQAPVYYHENASTNPDDHKPPHISTPPYVHHFDTYGLVKRLQEGGWTPDQAVTMMKAVRLVLAENIDLAREGLVSKSNVENETYLFRAACSELRTEIQTKRKGEVEKSRTERAQLQHEVDILGQKLTQDGGNLKDDLRGMFDDRKMAVRNEARHQESKVCLALVSCERELYTNISCVGSRTELSHHCLAQF